MDTSNNLNDFDVSETVCVNDLDAVANEVMCLLKMIYPNHLFEGLAQAFLDFDLLYTGRYKNYRACETIYHDRQHSLDMTLTMARIIVSHDMNLPDFKGLGASRAELGLITALFHDAGYIRRFHDTKHQHGAEYTRIHVTRSGQFLNEYLPKIGREKDTQLAAQLVHFTGYEVDPSTLLADDAKNRELGYALGSADLMAQMADRCYLEKCLERLYPEFVLSGMAQVVLPNGQQLYHSKYELIRKTPEFAKGEFQRRLNGIFGCIHENIRVLFDGEHPYMNAIKEHIMHAEIITESNDFSILNRHLPETLGMDGFPDIEKYLDPK